MSFKNKAKATAKNIEGKLQEGFGDITGNLETQAQGQDKQIQAKAMQDAEDLKEETRKAID